ncbi:MAG: hypothetical protein HN392_08475 [Anaerolineae bacterium]|jgi:hypothetical protein|nr:hypothetical protein [Anaerolineae bacterium]MBT7074287.1 hypothetical protein [Anaerolineae bacterium]MBT7783649.1 hypothetical protein [Anaerolineae bacterium]
MKKTLLPLLFILLFTTLACSVFSDAATTEEAPVPVEDSNILFQDDFSDSSSGWDSADWEDGLTDYNNGVYRMLVKIPSYDVWANPDKHFVGDISVEVDSIKVGGEDDNNFGLICRYSGTADAPSFYFFNISSDGYAVIGKVTEGSQEYISSEQMQPTDAIKQGNASNHLRAECLGNWQTLYVNGQEVATASDTAFISGNVGLMAGTFDVAGTEINFDNFLVKKP